MFNTVKCKWLSHAHAQHSTMEDEFPVYNFKDSALQSDFIPCLFSTQHSSMLLLSFPFSVIQGLYSQNGHRFTGWEFPCYSKMVWRPSQVYNWNPYSNETVSSKTTPPPPSCLPLHPPPPPTPFPPPPPPHPTPPQGSPRWSHDAPTWLVTHMYF